jgi:hypothetical protein
MTPIRIRRLSLFLPAALLAACAEGPPRADEVAGCWRLEWLDADTVVGVGTMPDSVRLDTAVVGGTDVPHRRVAFAGRAIPSDTLGPGDAIPWQRHFAHSHWAVGAGDSVRIVFDAGWTRYETAARVRGGRMRGIAAFRSDYEPVPPPTIAVRGERFACPR